MGSHTRRSVLVGLAAMAAGCSGQSDDGTTTGTDTRTSTDTPTDTPEETEEPTQTEEPVQEREWPDEYYQGPLVSAHEHMHGADGYSVVEEDLEWYLDWMDRNKVDQVVGFAADDYVDRMAEHDDRFLPFAFGWSELREELDNLVGAFQDRFEDHPYVGVGELGFKPFVTPEGEPPIQPDHPEALKLWDWAAEQDVPVMVHATSFDDYAWERVKEWDEFSDAPTKEHMANAMAHNRDTEFLVHATYTHPEDRDGPIVADALENNPNLTYDISELHPLAYGQGSFTEEEFQDRIEQEGGVEAIAEEFYQEHREILENYSDRLTWGMDAALEWHYQDEVLDTWVDVGRAVLGKLPEEKARNIGYRTAEDLFDIDVPEDEY